MPPFPSGSVPTQHFDSLQDKPGLALPDLLSALNLLNAMIASYDQASGICSLDGAGQVPALRLQNGLTKSGNLAGLTDQAAARTNIGMTTLGSSLATAPNPAFVLASIGALSTLGGALLGHISDFVDPSDPNHLTRKQWVENEIDARILTAGEKYVTGDISWAPGNVYGEFHNVGNPTQAPFIVKCYLKCVDNGTFGYTLNDWVEPANGLTCHHTGLRIDFTVGNPGPQILRRDTGFIGQLGTADPNDWKIVGVVIL